MSQEVKSYSDLSCKEGNQEEIGDHEHHTAGNKSLALECSQPIPRAQTLSLPGTSLSVLLFLGSAGQKEGTPLAAQYQMSPAQCFIALCFSPQFPSCRNFMDHYTTLISLLIYVFITTLSRQFINT